MLRCVLCFREVPPMSRVLLFASLCFSLLLFASERCLLCRVASFLFIEACVKGAYVCVVVVPLMCRRFRKGPSYVQVASRFF